MPKSEKKGFHFCVYLLPFIADFSNAFLGLIFVLVGVQWGLTPSEIGWSSTVYGIMYLIFPPFVGKLGEAISRKTSLSVATISLTQFSLIFTLLFPFVSSKEGFLLLILGFQFLKALGLSFYWPSLEAMFSEKTEHDEHAHLRAIRNFCISWSLGVAIGAQISGIVSEFSPEATGYIVSALYFIGFLIIRKYVPKNIKRQNIPEILDKRGMDGEIPQEFSEKRNENSDQKTKIKQGKELISVEEINNVEGQMRQDEFFSEEYFPFKEKGMDRSLSYAPEPKKKLLAQFKEALLNRDQLPILILLLGSFAFAVNYNWCVVYFANFAKMSEGLNWDDLTVSTVMFCFGLGHFSAYLFGGLRKGSERELLINLIGLVIGFAMLPFIEIWWLACPIIGFVGYNIGRLYFISLELTMKTSTKSKGGNAGNFESYIGLGVALAPLIAGGVAGWNLRLPFVVFVVMNLLIFTAMLLIQIQKRKTKNVFL